MSTGDLADIYQRIMLVVDHQEKAFWQSIAYSRAYTLMWWSGVSKLRDEPPNTHWSGMRTYGGGYSDVAYGT